MMISLFIILILIFHEASSYKSFGHELFVRNGDHFSVCCNISRRELKSNQALVLSESGTRLRSLLREGENYIIFDADSDIFLARHPGYIFESNGEIHKQFCVSKNQLPASSMDDKLFFQCHLIMQRGLGKLYISEVNLIRIYKLPVIVDQPTMVQVFEGNSTTLTCEASGHPDIKMVWRNSSSVVVMERNFTNSTVDGISTLNLTLGPVDEQDDGQTYTCEASTSFPKDFSTTTQNRILSVHSLPKLEITNATKYTDLNMDVDVKIFIRGKPEPQIHCEFQHTKDKRTLPIRVGVGSERHIRFKNVTTEDIGTYKCTATNSYGTVASEFELALGPSIPGVISPNVTEFADYFNLNWHTFTIAPLINVTIRIETIEQDLNDNHLNEMDFSTANPKPESKIRTLYFDELNISLMTYSHDDEAFHGYSQHIANLSANSEHKINIAVCNKHSCTGHLDNLTTEEINGLEPQVTFRTPEYNGTNNIDPSVLLRPPKIALSAVVWKEIVEKKVHSVAHRSQPITLIHLLLLTISMVMRKIFI